MLLFSTILSITDSLTPESFIKLVMEWNKGSNYPENIIPDMQWNGERNIRYGTDDLWLEIMEYPEEDILAVRYEKLSSDGRIWDSDYVVNFKEKKICIRLDRSYSDDAFITDSRFSTPHIITMLIERGYLKDDAGLETLRAPMLVGVKDAARLRGIFSGKKEYHLPIVYISRKKSGETAVDADWLASRLKGAAHILLADSSGCDRVFRERCFRKTETDGAIGIYYLSSVKRHKGFKAKRYEKYPELLLEKIVNHVISYEKIQKVDELYTWSGVRQAVLQERIRQSRDERKRVEEESRKAIERGEEAQNLANDLLASVDEEIKSLEAQVEQYRNQLESLQAENNGLRSKVNGLTSLPLLYMGDEHDLYEGEIKDIVQSVLLEARRNMPAGSRRADILGDILNANGYKGLSAERIKRIKELFKGYKNMSSAMRKELEAMGMEITEDGIHYKVRYYGDDRYYTSIAKSASDHREGDNISHHIIKGML